MRTYTCLALGVLAAVAIGACGSAEGDDAATGPAPYTGALPNVETVPAGVQPPSNVPASPSPTPVDPITPASNEGNPDVAPLQPAEPPAESGDDGTEPEGTPTEEPAVDPIPPVEPEPPVAAARTQVFLLFGQSNMYGLPAPQMEDLQINPRVEVLTLEACGRHGVNEWMPAQPPLHGCIGQVSTSVFGPGVGPGDYFARAIAAAFPEDTILLVPNAIPGVSIDVFQPGQQAYNSIVTRARMAQERGEISGMIFHQGETDCNSPQSRASWPGRVNTVVTQLRSDLGIGNAPFVAGELIYLLGCSGDMNPVIDSLPNLITNSAVVSANGNFAAVQGDNYDNIHFELAGQRELGRRYGAAMLGLLQP